MTVLPDTPHTKHYTASGKLTGARRRYGWMFCLGCVYGFNGFGAKDGR